MTDHNNKVPEKVLKEVLRQNLWFRYRINYGQHYRTLDSVDPPTSNSLQQRFAAPGLNLHISDFELD
jgi:hypothetical protein